MTRTPNSERKPAQTKKWSGRVLILLFVIALSLVSLPMLQSRAEMSGSDGLTPNGQAAVPTLVQHVATGMDRYPINTLTIELPNQVRAGNCLILGVQFNSEGSVASVTDDEGNNWIAGPTTTNSNFSKRMNLYYVLNAAAGTRTIRVNFNGLGSTPGFPQAVVSEFYNVATSNAFDGSAASPNSRTAGTITTTAPGDLIYEWGVSLSSSDENGGAFNGASITAGSGFTLLSADLQVGSGDQYQIQSTSGPITPTFSASESEVWGSLAIALKSAPAGTVPGSGIRIIHLQHTLMQAVRAQGRPDPIVMQFPSSGNLLVGLYNAAGPLATNVTDSLGNNWSLPASAKVIDDNGVVSAQIVYAANASTSPNLSGVTVSISATGVGDMMFNLYDITGAAASPFDLATTDQGDNDTTELTSGTITPRTTNGLVIHVNSIDFHQEHLMTSPAGGAFDTVTNDMESPDVSTLDMDNAYAHIYNSTTSQIEFTFTSCCTQAGVGPWAGVSAAFKGDGNASPTPTATPTPVVTPTPTGSPSPTVTPTPVVTPTPTGSPPPTVTPTPVTTPTPIGSPSPTVTPTPIVTPTPTGSPSPTVTPTPIATPTPRSQLGNISTRAFVQTGDNVMIGGFIVQGPQTKRVIIRAIGPELTQHGVPDAMSNPKLELHDATGALIASNDNWQTTIIGGIITSDQRAEIRASGHAPTDGRESAIIADLPSGNYTAIVRGVNDPTGVALAEVYDISDNTSSALGNISTRSFVQTGDNVMIGGFIVEGTQPKKVILRAIGPELTQHRVPDALADPTLELHDATGALIARNDNWVQTIIGGIITTNQVSDIRNSGHAPTDPRESAIIATLPPGNYTAIVRGANNTTGVGLVEAYDLD